MKDKLFIFLSIVLILLFAARIWQNITLCSESPSTSSPFQEEILSSLEDADLQPQEARYYKVIDE